MSSHSLRSLAMFGALFVAVMTLPSSLRAQQDATADRAITTNGSTLATRALPDSTWTTGARGTCSPTTAPAPGAPETTPPPTRW